MLNVNLSLHLV